MIKFELAVLCALMVLVGSTLFAQEIPSESRKGKEHRTGKAGVNNSAMMGDGSVRFLKGGQGTQSSGAGAGKISKTSRNLDAGSYKRTGKRGARLESRHPGGAN
jgi:hypothetical protein